VEPNEFVEKLLAETPLDRIEYASDVERILAEQVVYLRGHLRALQQNAVLGGHEIVGELYARLEDKDKQIGMLREEIGFLRQRLSSSIG